MSNTLTIGNARAIAFHVRQGKPFGGLTKEALATWLDDVATKLETGNGASACLHNGPTTLVQPEQFYNVFRCDLCQQTFTVAD